MHYYTCSPNKFILVVLQARCCKPGLVYVISDHTHLGGTHDLVHSMNLNVVDMNYVKIVSSESK